jgi:hypothetical protein
MKSSLFLTRLLSRALILGTLGMTACWHDDLGLRVSTPFTVELSPVQPIALTGESVTVRLAINSAQPVATARYELSYQNTTPLAVGVKLDGKVLARGQWELLPALTSLMSLRCDTTGQPTITILVRDHLQQLQTATLTYTTTR